MEAKKFISTIKGFRTRFTSKPNAELERKSVENTVEKMGGKLDAFSILKDADSELLSYVKSVLGIKKVEPSKESPKVESKKEKKSEEESTKEISTSKDGKLYEIDTVKKTCRRVLKDLSELANVDIEVSEMSMNTYLRYLKDKFPGEGAQIKKGKLYFRGYRVSCDTDNGFMIEDSTKRYAVVETEFEGIPTPKELGEFFNRPRIEHTPEELKAAVERGKELAERARQEAERNKEKEVVEVDFELLRKKVIGKIKAIRSKKVVDFDPVLFADMIPFRRWKTKVNALLKQWKTRKIRYVKFLNELEKVTSEETFEVKEKNHRSSFVGTLLPEFKSVGMLTGDKIEVDDKKVDAVPFLLDYILHYEPKAMQQIMRFANGEVTPVYLLRNPFHEDWKIEFNKRSLPNTKENAQVLTALCASIGLVAPQDLLYEADLKVGDKIMIMVDNEWKTETISQTDEGICVGKEIGLLKMDKWIKLND